MVDPRFGIPVEHVVHVAASPTVASGGGTEWTLILAVIGVVCGAISAAGVIAGGIYWFRTRGAHAERKRHEAELTEDVGELNSLVTGLVEEVRGRSPRPRVSFATKDGPSPGIVVRIPALPTVDVEAIVEAERAAALSTRLPIGFGTTTPPPAQKLSVALPAGLAETIASMQKMHGVLAMSGKNDMFLPVSEEQYKGFDVVVDGYENRVRAFIDEWIEYLKNRQVAVPLAVQIDNDGGAPAEEAKIKLYFPNPCGEAELPKRPSLLERPKFERKVNPLRRAGILGGLRLNPALLTMPRIPDLGPIKLPSDHSGPHYKKGSLEVSYGYESLPHHEPVLLDWFVVGIPEPGIYDVRWTIGARNLVNLEEGTLQLKVEYDEPNPEPVGTLGALTRARHAVD